MNRTRIPSNRLHRRTRRGAFTLVEMLLVITIIGILAALVVPKMMGRSEQAREAATDPRSVGDALRALIAGGGAARVIPSSVALFEAGGRLLLDEGVKNIVRSAAEQDYRFSALVLGLVRSEPFQMRMAGTDSARTVALK